MNRRSARALLGLLFFLMPLAAQASSLTSAQIQAIVNLLQAFNADPVVVAQIQSELGGSASGGQRSCLRLSRNLSIGSRGSDVSQLQQFLAVLPLTGYYGQLTAQAVRNWQWSHGIVSPGNLAGWGSVGPRTRAAMSCSTPTPFPAPQPQLQPSPGPQNPPAINSINAPASLLTNQGGTWALQVAPGSSPNLTYSVIWGDEAQSGFTTQPQTTTQTSFSFTHAYAQPGVYAPKFLVTTAAGQSTITAVTTVSNTQISQPVLSTLSPTQGIPGTQVIITGSNFNQYNNTVVFGGTSIPNITSSDGTSLTFTVPSVSAGTYSVYVQNVSGTSNAVVFTVTALNPSSIAIYSVTPSSGIPGSQATISGYGFTPAGNTVVFNSTVISNLASAAGGTSLTFTVPSMSSGTYNFFVQNTNGSSNAIAFVVTSTTTPLVINTDCSSLTSELPAVTNWSNATNSFSYLAGDQIQYSPTPIPSSGFDPSTLYYVFGTNVPNYLPTTNQYIGTTYDTAAVTSDQVNSFVQKNCSQAGVAIKVLRPDAWSGGRVVSLPGYEQVIHGIPMFGSKFSVLLPPNWNKNAAAGTYPILAEGFYQNNWLITQNADPMPVFIGQSGLGGKTGAIGVYWNGGGDTASRTLNPLSRTQFAQIINYVAQNFGGDPQRLALYGVSRGGITALLMASNPDPHQYRVRYVYAAAPEFKLGRLSQLFGATYPVFYDVGEQTIGLENAWTPGWAYPASAGHPELTGLGAFGATMKILTGSADPGDLDQNYAPIAPSKLAALKAEGTQVYLDTSTNDEFMPDGFGYDYMQQLRQSGIPFQAGVHELSGHGIDFAALTTNITQALNALMQGNQPTVQNNLITYQRVDRPSGTALPQTVSGGQAPFSLVVPQITYANLPSVLYFSGTPGTQYDVQLLNQNTSKTLEVQGQIQNSWDDIQAWNPTDPGLYQYLSLKIKQPSDTLWQYVSLRDTASASADRLYTNVLPASPPAQTGNALYKALKANLNPQPQHQSISWGVTQVSPTVSEGQPDFRLTVEYVDASGVEREAVLSRGNPSQAISVHADNNIYHVALEELGVNHSQPYSCQETGPGISPSPRDVTSWLFITPYWYNRGLSAGDYVFTCAYGGQTFTRTVTVGII